MGNSVINILAFPAPDPRYSKPFLERTDIVRYRIRTGEMIFAINLERQISDVQYIDRDAYASVISSSQGTSRNNSGGSQSLSPSKNNSILSSQNLNGTNDNSNTWNNGRPFNNDNSSITGSQSLSQPTQTTVTGPPPKRNAQYTILYSHGNAEDCGLILPYLEEIVRITGCNVFSYEYVGYSITEGKPSERGVIDSIDASYNYLTQVLGRDPEKIFLFGRSIGSGPTCDLASRLPHNGCLGIVLQSPLESGARAVFGSFVATIGAPFDIFKNIEKIENFKAPTVILHGEDDEVVPFHNGKNLYLALYRKGLAAVPYWVAGKGHNNMPETLCLQHIRKFIDMVIEKKEGSGGRGSLS